MSQVGRGTVIPGDGYMSIVLRHGNGEGMTSQQVNAFTAKVARNKPQVKSIDVTTNTANKGETRAIIRVNRGQLEGRHIAVVTTELYEQFCAYAQNELKKKRNSRPTGGRRDKQLLNQPQLARS